MNNVFTTTTVAAVGVITGMIPIDFLPMEVYQLYEEQMPSKVKTCGLGADH